MEIVGTYSAQGAQLYYPNTYNKPPRAQFDFWNYSPSGDDYDSGNPEQGWYIYGQGRVSEDRSQVIPDPGVVIYQFTGAMVGDPSSPGGPPPGNTGRDGDPVDLSTGLFVLTKTDLMLPDVIPITLTRTYRPNDPTSRAFGIGATHPYDIYLVGDTNPYTYIDVVLADGGKLHFPRTSSGTGYADAVYQHTSSPTGFYGATISWNGSGWTLKKKDGTILTFPDSDGTTVAQKAALIGLQDRNGNALTLARDGNSNLTGITTPNGRYIQFTYDSSNRIIQAQDNSGRAVNYTYNANGCLSTVTDANGGVTTYAYDIYDNMISVQDAAASLIWRTSTT